MDIEFNSHMEEFDIIYSGKRYKGRTEKDMKGRFVLVYPEIWEDTVQQEGKSISVTAQLLQDCHFYENYLWDNILQNRSEEA